MIDYQAVIETRIKNPCATLDEVGVKFGVTRERIRQILKKHGEPTMHFIQTYLCIQCGKDMGNKKKLFCDPECYHKYTHMKIACVWCGTLKEYRISYLLIY